MKSITNKGRVIYIGMVFALAALAVALVVTNSLALEAPSGMVAYWKFDESNGTVANDSVGTYDGAIVNATHSTGVVGNALSFSGADYVAIDDITFISTAQSFSYSVWVKFNQDISGGCVGPEYEYAQMIVSIHNGPYIYLGTSGRLITQTIRQDSSWMILKTTRCTWAQDTWYHIAVTLDSEYLKIYVNGSLENEIPGGLKNVTGDIYMMKFGKMHYLDDYYFNGVMDELAVYTRALTAEEVQQHYHNGLIGLGYEAEPPEAQAGPDQYVDRGATVTLDGSASSDPNNLLPLTYAWTQTGGPAVSFTPSLSITSFTAPTNPGVLSFTLNVTNTEEVPGFPDSVVITVTNQAPLADAGPDQTVYTQAVVTLDGGGSSDPDGDLPLAYLWQQTGGPAVTLSSLAVVTPTFTAPAVSTVLTFTLVVSDSLGLADPTPDAVVIRVQPYQVCLPLVMKP